MTQVDNVPVTLHTVKVSAQIREKGSAVSKPFRGFKAWLVWNHGDGVPTENATVDLEPSGSTDSVEFCVADSPTFPMGLTVFFTTTHVPIAAGVQFNLGSLTKDRDIVFVLECSPELCQRL